MFKKTKRYEMYENMRAAKERKRLEGDAPEYPAILPSKRREIIIRDFDFGKREKRFVLMKYRNRNDLDTFNWLAYERIIPEGT